MKIFKPQGIQSISIMPRVYLTNEFKIRIRDRDLGVNHFYHFDSSNFTVISEAKIVGNNLVITFTDYAISDFFSLSEGSYYDFELIEIYDENKQRPAFRETLFCTSQEISQKENKVYNPNLNKYKQKTGSDNEFIIL